MNEQRLKGLIGLSVRAGQAVFGETACRKLAEAGQCALLLLAEDASPNAADRYRTLSRRTGVPLLNIPPGMPEAATGRGCIAIGIRNGPFAEQFAGCLKGDN